MKEVRMATLELTYCHDTVVLRCEMTMPAINMSNFFTLLSAKFNFPKNLHDSGKICLQNLTRSKFTLRFGRFPGPGAWLGRMWPNGRL